MRFLTFLCFLALLQGHAFAGEFGRNADRMEMRFGGALYDLGLLTRPVRVTGAALNGEFLFASPEFLDSIGAPRPYVGIDVGIAPSPIHFIYAGLAWDYHFTQRFYVSGSVGGAIHTAANLVNPPTQRALGSRVLFHLGLAIGFDITPNLTGQIYTNHFSNAGLANPNEGHDSSGVRFGFRF
ncbi:MAG: acyloxyacyl hydrolase [Rhizobiaceae bacterium]|nr:acyloxyacyl hydrolase [Rhizobiaceae bacterium]